MCMSETVKTDVHLQYHEAQKVCACLKGRYCHTSIEPGGTESVCMTVTAGSAVYILYQEAQKV